MIIRRLDPIATGLVAGFVADRLLGDPKRWHPVAGFGNVAIVAQPRMYGDSRVRGAAYEALLVGSTVAGGMALSRMPRRLRWVVAGVATWGVLGGRSLEHEAMAVHNLAAAGDLSAARKRVRSLVGRDPAELDADGLARACVESLAENTSDAVVAPLFWGAVAGVPGLVGYRAVNTLDAMVGHRTPKWNRFGWAAARVDDLANLLPARLAASLTALLSGRPREVMRVVRRDAPKHPSPNAGPIESAFAATLDVRIGGENVYAGIVEDRGVLGDGAAVTLVDVPRAVALSRKLSWASLVALVSGRLAYRWLRTGM